MTKHYQQKLNVLAPVIGRAATKQLDSELWDNIWNGMLLASLFPRPSNCLGLGPKKPSGLTQAQSWTFLNPQPPARLPKPEPRPDQGSRTVLSASGCCTNGEGNCGTFVLQGSACNATETRVQKLHITLGMHAFIILTYFVQLFFQKNHSQRHLTSGLALVGHPVRQII